jgi:PhnB protein
LTLALEPDTTLSASMRGNRCERARSAYGTGMAKIKRPEGHHVVTPSFCVPHAAQVIEFLERAFGGKVVDRYDGPEQTVMHAEVRLGDSAVMLGDPTQGMPAMPAMLSFYVDDGDQVDVVYKKALAAGATGEMEPKNQFYGYRSATVRDVGGNRWTICAVVEELTKAEIEQRMANLPH